MNIAIARRYELGRFTIQERPRPDNPAFPVYIVILRGVEIGRSFSIPDCGCCEWLLLHPVGSNYAPPATNKPWDYGHRTAPRRRWRTTKEESAAPEPEEVT